MKGLTAKQYIGGAERTTPLEDGAEAVLGALDLIRHRIATALDKNLTFNEVLSAAYMEKQKMAVSSFSTFSRDQSATLTDILVPQ